MLKEYIKKLAEDQILAKKARKTGSYTLEVDKWGTVIYDKVPVKVRESWRAAFRVRYQKAFITAALNLYHEIRGSDYRHNIPDDYDYRYAYNECMTDLREKLKSGIV